MSTFDTIRDIFYSGTHAFRGDKDSISEIAFFVDEGYLSLSALAVASKNSYKNHLENPDKLKKIYEAAGGGVTHVVLKILGSEFLKNSRNQGSIFEHPFCGYYPDVLSDDKTIIIECGHTQNSEKMLAYFREGNIKECIQVPYPTDEDTEVKGYSFIARDDLKEFLIFYEKEKRTDVKNIFFKR